MQIINNEVKQKFKEGIPIKLNIGGGPNRKDGFYNLDIIEDLNVDIRANLNQPLKLIPDNSVEEIYSSHVLEHINNTVNLMEEIFRISTPDAKIKIIVPHFSNPYYYSDPTHQIFFGLYTMFYFVSNENQPSVRQVPNFYSECRFIVKSIQLELLAPQFINKLLSSYPRLSSFISHNRLLQFFSINRNIKRQAFYEKWLCRILPTREITYIISPEKN